MIPLCNFFAGLNVVGNFLSMVFLLTNLYEWNMIKTDTFRNLIPVLHVKGHEYNLQTFTHTWNSMSVHLFGDSGPGSTQSAMIYAGLREVTWQRLITWFRLASHETDNMGRQGIVARAVFPQTNMCKSRCSHPWFGTLMWGTGWGVFPLVKVFNINTDYSVHTMN